jgi:hypothetical protein
VQHPLKRSREETKGMSWEGRAFRPENQWVALRSIGFLVS